MSKLTNVQKKDELVKSLLDSGFSEELISEWVDSGDITIKSIDDEEEPIDEEEKSKKSKKSNVQKSDDEDIDIDEEDDDVEVDIDEDDDDEPIEEEEEKSKKSKKSCGKDKLAKGVSSDIKSMEEALGRNRHDIVKAIEPLLSGFEKAFDKMSASIESLEKSIEKIGRTAPNFKSEGLSKAYLQKSIEFGGGVKDEDNKTVLSVTRDRQVVRELINKSIEEESDVDIRKSLVDNTNTYLLDPLMGVIGEPAARYFYDKKNVRLVQ